MALFPIAVRAWENHGRQAAQEQMRSNAALLMAVGLPCVVGLAILAPGIAHTFLGHNFQATAARIIPLVALGAFLAGFKAYHFDAAFQFAHRTIYQVWIVLFAAIVNLALNYFAIPIWGINGAAGASVVAYLIAIALTASLGRRHFVLPFPALGAAQVLLAAGLMAAALTPFRSELGVFAVTTQIAIGAAIYATVLISLNFLGLRDTLLRRFTGPATSHLAEAQLR
jgi:O-antigen/teichoic acid export membrane protein